MDAESFLTWVDGVRSPTRDQCGKAFMMVALRDGDDDADWMGSEAVDETAMYDASAMTTTRGDEAVVPPVRPMGASIEATVALWASSLREAKRRLRPLFAQERAAVGHSAARYRCPQADWRHLMRTQAGQTPTGSTRQLGVRACFRWPLGA